MNVKMMLQPVSQVGLVVMAAVALAACGSDDVSSMNTDREET
jgi:hypothetical protein